MVGRKLKSSWPAASASMAMAMAMAMVMVMALQWAGAQAAEPQAADSQASAPQANPAQIQVKDFMFMPTTVTVSAGAQVTWVNKDDEPHTVVSDTGTFRSGAMDTNGSFSFKFDKPGTYHFTCSIHPRMVGTVIVK